MNLIETIKVANGIYWMSIPGAGLRMLCGCPADAIKHLKKQGLVRQETAENGLRYETGPNTILLSDTTSQQGEIANLTEFPVLHMLYLQGMILPGHPNNNGSKPLLVGHPDCLKSQVDYIYRGNYGLVSEEELLEAGIPPDTARLMMQVKLRFAFGKIAPPDSLVAQCPVTGSQPASLGNGVSIRRKGINIFEVSYQGETATVDLNLAPGTAYEATFKLGIHSVPRSHFAVVHTGEGDGWDTDRPCMASILVYKGKIYLIDAGPNILTSLRCLGISVNEIEGLFHSHAHDDHFAGLAALMRTDHRIKYYASPMVRAAVTKKLSALMAQPEDKFLYFFEVCDLPLDEWTSLDGLEVKPVYSPHPVETNVFFFRLAWEGGYKTYSHLADTLALDSLSKMVADGVVPHAFYEETKAAYLAPANLKKVDVGGGMIHGVPADYAADKSAKIVLAHTAHILDGPETAFGAVATFGDTDELVPAQENHLYAAALAHLRFYFPGTPTAGLEKLLAYPEHISAGSSLLENGDGHGNTYLLLSGLASYTDASGAPHLFPAGSLIGQGPGLTAEDVANGCTALSHLAVLKIPNTVFQEFLDSHQLAIGLEGLGDGIRFLLGNPLFSDAVSYPVLARLAKLMEPGSWPPGHQAPFPNGKIFLLKEGLVRVYKDGLPFHELRSGSFFGGGPEHQAALNTYIAEAVEPSSVYSLPAGAVSEIPVANWKLLETYIRWERGLLP